MRIRFRHISYTLIALNLALFLMLGMFIYSRGGIEYLKAKYVQIVNKETVNDSFIEFRNNRIESFRRLPIKNTDVLLVGDSITEYGFWGEYLGGKFKNRGIGGETTGGLKEWFSEIIQKKPAAIVMLIGINNLKSGENVQETYLSDMDYFCKNIPQTIRGVIVGILPINESMAKGFIHCTNSELTEINKQLKELAARFSNIEYVNPYPELVEKGTNQLNYKYTIDGVHLNHQGYQQYVDSVLKPLFTE